MKNSKMHEDGKDRGVAVIERKLRIAMLSEISGKSRSISSWFSSTGLTGNPFTGVSRETYPVPDRPAAVFVMCWNDQLIWHSIKKH